MIKPAAVNLDQRRFEDILNEFLQRRPGYVKEWIPSEGDSGSAIINIFLKYFYSILLRLNQTPEKNKLAFLDLLGIQLVPAQSSIVPIVFQLSSQAADSQAPQGTKIAAPPPPEQTDQVVFETKRSIGLTSAKLKQIISLWSGRDGYIDHTLDFLAGQTIYPFKKKDLQTTPHILYIGHSTLLNLSGKAQLSIELEIVQPGSQPLNILWEYWDGQLWRGFKTMNPICGKDEGKLDGTNGFTRSGSFIIEAECIESSKIKLNKNSIKITEDALTKLELDGVPDDIIEKLGKIDTAIYGEGNLVEITQRLIGSQNLDKYKPSILKYVVRGVENYWVRCRIKESLPPNPKQILPEVDRIRLSSIISQLLNLSRKAIKTESMIDDHGNKIECIVLDANGLPISGVSVIILNPDVTISDKTTDDDGKVIFEIISIPGSNVYTIRFSYQGIFHIEEVTYDVTKSKLTLNVTLQIKGLKLDKAFSDGNSLDVSKPFYPFSLQPQPGSTFYFKQDEVFSKPGAKVQIYIARTNSPQDSLDVIKIQQEEDGSQTSTIDSILLKHIVDWEYWNGKEWVILFQSSDSDKPYKDLNNTEIINFTIPIDIAKTKINDQEGLWMRARLVSGGFGFTKKVSWRDNQTGNNNNFTYVITKPPALSDFLLGYSWQYGPYFPEEVLTYNDFQFEDHTDEAKWPGKTFKPYKPVSDVTPAFYLGFDKSFPLDRISTYFDIDEQKDDIIGPPLKWECWDGISWRNLSVEDETNYLRIPGLLSFIASDNAHALARFETELYWLRGRLKEDGPPGNLIINGIYPNSVWAIQQQTITNEALGTSTGQPNQVFTFRQIPVLSEEVVEVRELSRARANVEWRALAMELFDGNSKIVQEIELMLGKEGTQTDIIKDNLRLKRDRNKKVTEVWVLWNIKKNFFFSGPNDRDYVMERSRGKLTFGNGQLGKIPPLGSAISAQKYITGGGIIGNVGSRAISQLLGGIAGIESVFNPAPAEGGADGETLENFNIRGPKTLSNRGRAVLTSGYETMAKEASPAVAFSRAIPTRNNTGQKIPGWITLIIIPQSDEPSPWPSFGLRENVREYIEARTPADLAGTNHIYITGPDYYPIDVNVTAMILPVLEAGIAEDKIRIALETFLHPLTGGSNGNGWELGRDVFLSDVASLLERIDGVDYIIELELLLKGELQDETVKVPDDKIVTKGEIKIKIRQD